MHDPLENHVPFLSLNCTEKASFASFYHTRKEHQYSSAIDQMLSFFHYANGMENRYLRFISRVTAMEMLIDGQGSLSYRLRHHIAVLLGKDTHDSETIAVNMKNIYSARSKYLHDGKIEDLTDANMELAFDYSRRMIAILMQTTDNIGTIRKTLEQAGYGSNPYHAEKVL